MARVPYLDSDDLPPERRQLLERPINLNRALAHSPGALEANRFIGRWARYRSSVDPRLRELAILAVGALSGDVYEYAHHVHFAEEAGATGRDIDDVQRHLAGEPTGLEPAARLVLDAARMLTVEGRLDDSGWAALEVALGRQAAVELIFIVSYYCMAVRVLGALGIDLEEDWAHYLRAHPLR